MSNVFQLVKQNVSARQAAEAYGLKISHHGMACCPFHDDKSPSMKVDDRYYCFGCHATGDVIDLTARLLHLPVKDAAVRLAQDFHLPIDPIKPNKQRMPYQPRADPEKQKYDAVNKAIKTMLDVHSVFQRWKTEYAPQRRDDDWHPLFCEAVQQLPFVEYLLDELMTSDKEQALANYYEYRKEIQDFDRRMEEYFSGSVERDKQRISAVSTRPKRKAHAIDR